MGQLISEIKSVKISTLFLSVLIWPNNDKIIKNNPEESKFNVDFKNTNTVPDTLKSSHITFTNSTGIIENLISYKDIMILNNIKSKQEYLREINAPPPINDLPINVNSAGNRTLSSYTSTF